MEMNRDFKGVWIPKEIWLNKELNWVEKVLLVEIDSLDNDEGCFATNSYFAEFFDLSKDRISKLISSLKTKGYIEVELIYKPNSKQVDKRVIKVDYKLFKKGYTKSKGGIGENNHRGIGENNYRGIGENTDRGIGENTEDNNTDINNTNIIPSLSEGSKEKSLEKELFDYWNTKKIVVHKKLSPVIKKECTVALNKYSIEEIKGAIDSYAIALNDTEYKFCNYTKPLKDFLKQGNMMADWLEDGTKCINYMKFCSTRPSSINSKPLSDSGRPNRPSDDSKKAQEIINAIRQGKLNRE